MPTPTAHMPPGFSAVTPFLTADDPDRLVSFAKTAFGAEEIEDQRGVGPDGKTMHLAFRVEGCVIEVGVAHGPWKALPGGIHLYVRDVDSVYRRALKAGGVSLHNVREMEYGERSGAIRDPCGNHWYIATYANQQKEKR